MDVFQFHILLGLLPNHISYGLMSWLINTHIIPKVEDSLSPTIFKKKFAFLDEFNQQAKELHATALGIYLQLAKALENLSDEDNKQSVATACVTLHSFVHLMNNLIGHEKPVNKSYDGVANPSISADIKRILGYKDEQELIDLMLNELKKFCERHQLNLAPYIEESQRLRYKIY